MGKSYFHGIKLGKFINHGFQRGIKPFITLFYRFKGEKVDLTWIF